MVPLLNRCYAEFFGTFALVFFGTGAIVANEISGGAITHLGISVTFGLIVLAMIYALGQISGAHINPAVTVGFAFAGRFPAKEILPYIGSQCLGAIIASFCLSLLFPDASTLGETLPSGSMQQSFILEVILTFFLMFVIIQVSTGPKEAGIMAGIAIAATVGLEALFAGPISGASMNPARSLGPALVHMHFESQWIYFVAPFIGSGLAILSYQLIKGKA